MIKFSLHKQALTLTSKTPLMMYMECRSQKSLGEHERKIKTEYTENTKYPPWDIRHPPKVSRFLDCPESSIADTNTWPTDWKQLTETFWFDLHRFSSNFIIWKHLKFEIIYILLITWQIQKTDFEKPLVTYFTKGIEKSWNSVAAAFYGLSVIFGW